MNKKIEELLNGIEIIKRNYNIEEITGISTDSRTVKKGNLFIAIRGEKFDGHEFCQEALNKGASLLVVEKEPPENFPYILVPNTRTALSKIASNYYGNPSEKLKVIGVTGTNGKTTTCYLLSSLFPSSICFTTVKYFGIKSNIKAINTTPSPILLHKELQEAYRNNLKTAIIEVSSIGIDQDRVKDIDFDYAIFTNISRDHLDYHKTFENYLDAKAKFFETLKEDKIAVINADDPNSSNIIRNSKSKVVTFGLNRGNIRGEILKNSKDGIVLKIEGLGRSFEISSPLLGKFNALNILAATSIGILEKLQDSEIKERIENSPIPPGRLQKVKAKEGISVFIDYAHTPDALFSTILCLREYNPKRIITVFGAGGNRDKGKRSLMGNVASNLSDLIIVTSDNPRDEEPEAIIDDIFKGIEKNNATRLVDRKEAIFKALSIAEEGDFILIAGKGHEDYQEIKGERFPFSDKECVEEFYKK
ncbi:MAG: UDP-N-acetylmuramoyl-L-alanyl-D-glutamate--2,6-diaminopimelate ligase [candidate division WOR-3 bacterium]